MAYTRRAALVFLILGFAYAYFLRVIPNSNVNSRLGLVFAVVQEGRLTIDSYATHHHLGTVDKAVHDGHYYSEKAIGTAVLGVLVYGPIHWMDSLLQLNLHFYLLRYFITLGVVALPAAFAGSLFYIVCEHVSGDRWHSFLVTLALGLGTMLWPFSTVLFGHALAAALLWIAFFLMLRLRHSSRSPRASCSLAIGFLLGFAGISEFPVTPIVLALGVFYLYLLHERKELRPALILSAGAAALLPIALQLAYNWACFGSPFSLGYGQLAHEVFRELHGEGFLGVSWPQPSVLYYLTLHPIRGLFVQAPVLLAGLVGFYWIWKRQRWRAEGVLAAFALLSLLWINAGFGTWWGGATFAPRHLIPALFFLGLPLAFLPARTFLLVSPLAVLSVLHMLIPTAGDPLVGDPVFFALQRGEISTIPYLGHSPIYGGSLEQLRGWGFRGFTPNVGMLLGLQGPWSLLPLCAVTLSAAILFRRRCASHSTGQRN